MVFFMLRLLRGATGGLGMFPITHLSFFAHHFLRDTWVTTACTPTWWSTEFDNYTKWETSRLIQMHMRSSRLGIFRTICTQLKPWP